MWLDVEGLCIKHMYRDVSRDLVVQYYVEFVSKTRIYRDVSRTLYCSSTLLEIVKV